MRSDAMAEPRTYSGNGHTATIADPENITRDECLALARCGATAWNKWREEFPVRGDWPGPYKNCANFASQGICLEQVDFSEFKFGHGADFSDAKLWNGFFASAEFGHNARFIGVQLEGRPCFDGARFGLEACFDRSEFAPYTSFSACEFDSRATFHSARFGESFNCGGAVFGDGAEFDWSHFDQFASFQGTLFQGCASFVGASFGSSADLSGLMAGSTLSFDGARFEGQTTFQGRSWGALKRELQLGEGKSALETFANEWHASPWVFKAISFQGATFGGSVDFSDRHFEGVTEFSSTRSDIEIYWFSTFDDPLASNVRDELASNEFERVYLPEGRSVRFTWPPDFFQCKLHQNTSFDRAVFPSADGSEDSARAYRVLKLAFSQQQATREEQRFFRLEMAEEAKAAEKSHAPAKWLYIAYRELADFGFSIRRPTLLLVITLLLMLPLYAWQAGLQACWPGATGCGMTGPLIQFASAHALPGFEKLAEPASKTLFGDQLGVFTVLTLLLHKAVSVLALFLIGLALRNLFKMK